MGSSVASRTTTTTRPFPRDPTLFASASFLAFSLAAWAFLRSASA